MKTRYCLLTVILLLFCVSAISYARPEPDTLFQVSTINALMQGIYDGKTTIRELKQHGSFGIGCFNALDGEMVGLDGKFYQIRADGSVHLADDAMKAPFASVLLFQPKKSAQVTSPTSSAELQKLVESLLTTKNVFWAIRVNGDFSYAKTRSVPKQSKPHKLLLEITKTQPTFEFRNVRGTLVGFYCPAYAKGLNVPGFHLHFLTADAKGGGHMLDCELATGTIELEPIHKIQVELPASPEFYALDLAPDMSGDLKKVEK